jgi:hypothetical protein
MEYVGKLEDKLKISKTSLRQFPITFSGSSHATLSMLAGLWDQDDE